MVDLENGRDAGYYRFESVELAANFVIGATVGGICRIARSRSGARQIRDLAEMVLLGLGADGKTAREAITSTHAHLIECAPRKLSWWHDNAGRHTGKAATLTQV